MLSQLNYNPEQKSQLSIWQVEHKLIKLKAAIRQTFFFLFCQAAFTVSHKHSSFISPRHLCFGAHIRREETVFSFLIFYHFFRQRPMYDQRYTRKTLENQQVECKWLTFKIIKQTKQLLLHQLDSVFSRKCWGLFILGSMHLWLSMRREELLFVLIQESLTLLLFWFFPCCLHYNLWQTNTLPSCLCCCGTCSYK